ncbi:MAG: short-chain fatty acyl-CoA regulator family protein [Paracoccus sp. (in: a-proteobacteria)]|nr:short-chain fatty acyl-CoA regulator family protein [Paracoccus sp. (in: a-proteobacteria)]
MSRRPATSALTGTRIRERRLTLGRRQGELARALGISAAYLNLIEHNRRAVSQDLMSRLAIELDVPPEELSEGREEARLAGLREAAALPAEQGPTMGAAPELDQAAEFLARFPGWAGLLLAQARRARATEARLVDLSDRMAHDPYLLTTLHEVLSAVTSLRSTASILVEEDDIPPEWRMRFHANLAQDSQRLSLTAQELVRYLDSFEAEGVPLSPQEEVETWLAERDGAPDSVATLASDAARAMAGQIADDLAEDRRNLPDAALHEAVSRANAGTAGIADPLDLAADLAVPLDLVMRRLAMLRPPGYEGVGLMICDGSGALVLRRAPHGLVLPRPGESCPLWPLFAALAVPQTVMAHHVVTPEGRSFRTLSHGQRSQPRGLGGPVLTRAQMLMIPEREQAPPDAIPVGPVCRICPRAACPARREPSILAGSTSPRAVRG